MTCFSPLSAFRTINNEIIFNANKRGVNITEALKLPCGQCIGCRLERSRQWAIRCVHEASQHEKNSFITLTYRDADLPSDMSLSVRHWQLFMKRLRERTGAKIRFFHCGEYGSRFGRPHYHACLFGFDFADKTLFKIERNNPLYISKTLDDVWQKGFATIGDVTFESAAYVARYIMKKVTGDAAAQHYEWIHPITGQIYDRKPEYTTMSRRPGIGSSWFDLYHSDVYPHDRVVIRGKAMRPPRFYDGKYEILDPEGFEEIKFKRYLDAQIHIDNNTPERLKIREAVQKTKLDRLKRTID